MSKNHLLTRYVLIPLGIFTFFIFIILYFNQAQTCTAYDSNPNSKERTFSAMTLSEACRKAVAVCTYYSQDPKSCRKKIKK